MVRPLRHRQTKGAATDMHDLTPPRHIPTLPVAAVRQQAEGGCGSGRPGRTPATRQNLSAEGLLCSPFQAAGAKNLGLFFKLFSMAAAGQGRRHDHETTVDHALMRGLVAAGPVIRRGASSV